MTAAGAFLSLETHTPEFCTCTSAMEKGDLGRVLLSSFLCRRQSNYHFFFCRDRAVKTSDTEVGDRNRCYCHPVVTEDELALSSRLS